MAAVNLDPKSDKNGLLRYDESELDAELVVVARLRCVEHGEREDKEGDSVPFAKWKAYAIEAIDPKRAGTAVDLLEDLYTKRTGKQPLDLGGDK